MEEFRNRIIFEHNRLKPTQSAVCVHNSLCSAKTVRIFFFFAPVLVTKNHSGYETNLAQRKRDLVLVLN